jgi:thiol-disulfide isomerase/thioredoxin
MNAADVLSSLDHWGFSVARVLLTVLWQSSIVFAAVAALSWLLRKRRAGVRHALWLTALLVAPVLPLLTMVVSQAGAPQAPVSVLPTYTEPAPFPAPAFEPALFPAVPPEVSAREMPAPTVEPTAPEVHVSVWNYPWALLLTGYSLGLALFVGWVALGRIRIAQWIRSASPVTDGCVLAAFKAAREKLRVTRDFPVLETDCIPAPVTAGLFRPVVLLPRKLAEGLSPLDVQSIAVHELAHIARRDPFILSVIALVRAALFFHPLVWLACRQISALAEQAADDAVLDVTGEPIAYAKMLARLAENLRRRALTAELAAGIVLSKGAFLRRVEAILSDRRDSLRRLSRRALALTILAALLSLFLASALPLSERPTARLAEKDATEAQASVSVWVSGGKPDATAPPAVTNPVETAKGEVRQSSVKPVPLTKKEILQSVEALRSKIEDLSVSFTFDAVQGGDTPDFVGARMHQTVVTKGDKTYIDYQFGAAPKYQQPLFRREMAFNGERSTVHEVSRGVASVRTTRERETNTQGRGFFDLMLLNPPRANGFGSDDQSLLSLLRSDLSLLREEMESVNGHRCYVLDVTHPSLGKTCMTVWLDADRGLLPIKHVYYFGKDLDLIILEFVIEEAMELDEGLWFAVRGYKRVGPVPADSLDPNWALVHEMKADGVEEHKPKIAVNTGIGDEFFDLWKRVPTGTRVVDLDVGTERVFMSEEDAPKPPPQLGSPAPELVLEQGAGVTLAQFKGRPVVIAFVSIYSRPCVKVMDDLKALQEKQGADKLGVIAVHDRTATREEIEQFRKDHSISFPIVRVKESEIAWSVSVGLYPPGVPLFSLRVPPDASGGWDSATFRAYGVTALPTVVRIDAKGAVASLGDGEEEPSTPRQGSELTERQYDLTGIRFLAPPTYELGKQPAVELLKTFTAYDISPSDWERGRIEQQGATLTVVNTEDVHRHVADILEGLRKHKDQGVGLELTVVWADPAWREKFPTLAPGRSGRPLKRGVESSPPRTDDLTPGKLPAFPPHPERLEVLPTLADLEKLTSWKGVRPPSVKGIPFLLPNGGTSYLTVVKRSDAVRPPTGKGEGREAVTVQTGLTFEGQPLVVEREGKKSVRLSLRAEYTAPLGATATPPEGSFPDVPAVVSVNSLEAVIDVPDGWGFRLSLGLLPKGDPIPEERGQRELLIFGTVKVQPLEEAPPRKVWIQVGEVPGGDRPGTKAEGSEDPSLHAGRDGPSGPSE